MKPPRTPVIGARDQAAGLRNLFKDGAAIRALSLLVANAADVAPTLVLGLAQTLMTQGRRVLVIDETPLDATRLQPIPLHRVQYDLGQGLTRTTSLDGCIKLIQPNLYFASAARIAKHLDSHARREHLPDALRASGLEIDYLLIIAGRDHARHYPIYGNDQLVWLLTDAANTMTEQRMDQLLKLCAPYQGFSKSSALPTMVVGQEQTPTAKTGKQAAFESLKKRFVQFSKLRPDYLGWISTNPEGAEAPIPVSLLQELSRRLLV